LTAETPALVRTFAVGERTVTVTVPRAAPGAVVAMAFEWSPDTPPRLSPSEWREYRTGRDAALAELADVIGGKIAVVEL
jgi:hypothetical protein